MKDMARLELKYVKAFKDRHGKLRHYFRRKGYQSVALPGNVGSVEFMEAYAQAAGQKTDAEAKARIPKGQTIRALRAAYYVSPKYKKLSARTKHAYRLMIDKAMAPHDDKQVANIRPKHVNAILAAMSDTPAQASNLRKRLLAMFSVAVSKGWRDDNPVRESDRVEYVTRGFAPWSDDDIEQFEGYWPVGSKPRDALTILLTTGIRRSDAHTLGRQHIRNGLVSFVQDKGGERVTMPAHADLLAIVQRMPPGQLTLIVTAYGKPFTEGGFTNWFTDKAREAGIVGRTPHGVRKALGRHLAEGGASEKEIAAALGHDDPNTAKTYTKSADQAKLAAAAMGKIGVKVEQSTVHPLDTVVNSTVSSSR